ncbi:MAG: J domain-containing protein [Halobacteriaceae archaeon]
MVPQWLLAGLGGAAALTVIFAAVFAAGERFFPAPSSGGPDRTGARRRRREIRDYLDAIGEQYAEEHPVAGHPVAFYLPDRDVAITFDARAYFDLEAADHHAILVEHEMPGAHLGARLPFETPAVGGVGARGAAEPSPESRPPVDRPFAELGIDPTDSVAEIRAAYRERVKEVHPDQGGDEAAFRRVQAAYASARERAE